MRSFVAISIVVMLFLGPVGEMIGGAIEVGYMARESNTRLAVATVRATGAEGVSASGYAEARGER